MLSGLVDAQISGNQSYPQTIIGLSKSWKLFLLSGVPKDVVNMDYDFSSKYFEYQNRGSLFYKNIFLKMKGKHKPKLKTNQDDALADYDTKAGILMTIFSFALAIKIVFQYFCDPKLRNINQIYCYENIGILAGIFINKIRPHKTIIRRYQGTPIPLNKLKRSWLRHGSFLASLQWSESPIVMANDGTYGDLIAKEYAPSSSIFFERNGLPDYVKDFSSRERKKVSSDIKIIAVSKLKAWKNVDQVFAEVSKIAKINESYNFILDIVGDGPEYKRLLDIKSSFERNNLCIQMIGAVGHKIVLNKMSKADLFISLYGVSNLGNPLLEALFLKMPIITKPEPEIKKILGDNYNGFIDRIDDQDILNVLKSCSKDIENLSPNIKTWENRMEYEISFLKQNKFCSKAS